MCSIANGSSWFIEFKLFYPAFTVFVIFFINFICLTFLVFVIVLERFSFMSDWVISQIFPAQIQSCIGISHNDIPVGPIYSSNLTLKSQSVRLLFFFNVPSSDSFIVSTRNDVLVIVTSCQPPKLTLIVSLVDYLCIFKVLVLDINYVSSFQYDYHIILFREVHTQNSVLFFHHINFKFWVFSRIKEFTQQLQFIILLLFPYYYLSIVATSVYLLPFNNNALNFSCMFLWLHWYGCISTPQMNFTRSTSCNVNVLRLMICTAKNCLWIFSTKFTLFSFSILPEFYVIVSACHKLSLTFPANTIYFAPRNRPRI